MRNARSGHSSRLLGRSARSLRALVSLAPGASLGRSGRSARSLHGPWLRSSCCSLASLAHSTRFGSGSQFGSQFQKLVADHPGLGRVLILHNAQCRPSIIWLPWSRTVWKFVRAWNLIRLTGAFPLIISGAGGLSKLLLRCPLCGMSTVEVEHVLVSCPGTARFRLNVPPGSLQGVANVNQSRQKVCFVGLWQQFCFSKQKDFW